MARVTVEDCLENVENRFDLVLKATNRARALELGAADAMVPLDNDKPTVVALREIAGGFNITGNPQAGTDDADVMFASDMMQQPDVIRPEEPSSAADFFRSSFGGVDQAQDSALTDPFSRFVSQNTVQETDAGAAQAATDSWGQQQAPQDSFSGSTVEPTDSSSSLNGDDTDTDK